MIVRTARGEIAVNVRLQHIEEWKSSGLAKEAYCSKNGVTLNQLTYWQRRLDRAQARAPGKRAAFAKVVTPGPGVAKVAVKSPALRLVIGSAFVEIGESADPIWAARVIAAIGGRA